MTLSPELERVYQYSLAINQLRREMNELARTMAKKQEKHDELVRQLDQAIMEAHPHTQAPAPAAIDLIKPIPSRDPARVKAPVRDVVTVAEKIRIIFMNNPNRQFSAMEIIKELGLGYMSARSTVRQNLLRLSQEGVIVRMEKGMYQLKPGYEYVR